MSNEEDLSEARRAMTANGLSDDEIARVLKTTASLFDEDAHPPLALAADVSSDSVAPALRAVLASEAVFDWKIVIAGNDAQTERHPFMTDREYEEHRIRSRDSHRQALIGSCDGNIVAMLNDARPAGMLMPTGQALPAGIEWKRNPYVQICCAGTRRPAPEHIRYVLLATYLDCAMHGDASTRKTFERIADLVSRKVIPYGLRKSEPGVKPTFLCFGA